jgi:hypothetical protein
MEDSLIEMQRLDYGTTVCLAVVVKNVVGGGPGARFDSRQFDSKSNMNLESRTCRACAFEARDKDPLLHDEMFCTSFSLLFIFAAKNTNTCNTRNSNGVHVLLSLAATHRFIIPLSPDIYSWLCTIITNL